MLHVFSAPVNAFPTREKQSGVTWISRLHFIFQTSRMSGSEKRNIRLFFLREIFWTNQTGV
jgi:hypothetical protein